VRHLIDTTEAAGGALAETRRAVAALDGEANELAQRRVAADDAVRDRGGELVAAVRAHLERAVELRLLDLATTST
jgi:hypothetical protein